MALVIESLGRGGAERLLATTVGAFDPTRVEARVVMLGGDAALVPEFEAMGVRITDLGMEGPASLPRTVRRLRRVLREDRVDVVHSHLYFANQAARLATLGTGVRLVTTLHNPDYTHEAHAGLRFRGRKALERLTLALRPGTLLAVSGAVRDDYRAHFDLPAIEVLPNFMPVAPFQARVDAVDGAAARGAVGAEAGDVVLLHVGRFHRQKGHDVLLRAFAALRRRHPATRLVLAGKGSLRPSMEALAESEGVAEAVHFAGVVADPAPLYAAADAFVFPSRYEAFGIALLEAMAAGLPAVVSRTGGIPDVAAPDCARFVPPGEVDALTEGLTELVADPALRARMGHAARRRAAAFDAAVQVRRLEAIYADA